LRAALDVALAFGRDLDFDRVAGLRRASRDHDCQRDAGGVDDAELFSTAEDDDAGSTR
jgi:hypothetical protein